ncbi:MAG: hypothetical protein ABI140_04060, partial [Jatrophihabitantaceae bacterium]
MSNRVKLISLAVVCLLAVAGSVSYLLNSRSNQQRAAQAAAPVAQIGLSTVLAEPRIIFRSTAPSDHYGSVAAVALSDPAGPRAFIDTQCDRVYAANQRLLCLSSDRGLVTTYAAKVLAVNGLGSLLNVALAGVPSRARLSRDGQLAATTSFTQGDSYAATSFSTRTVIDRVGGPSLGSLEDFKLI